jgi:hypothetical protein
LAGERDVEGGLDVGFEFVDVVECFVVQSSDVDFVAERSSGFDLERDDSLFVRVGQSDLIGCPVDDRPVVVLGCEPSEFDAGFDFDTDRATDGRVQQ